jgi:hypothetical protein
VQNASVVSALRYMTAGLPLGVALISVVCMQWYHIDEVRACAVCRRLENRRGGERAESREQRAESREQRAESREQRGERREERGERREERGERREQRGGARAYTYTCAQLRRFLAGTPCVCETTGVSALMFRGLRSCDAHSRVLFRRPLLRRSCTRRSWTASTAARRATFSASSTR